MTPEDKKNTMENMTKEQDNLIRLINDGLSELHTKQVEYTECAVSGNPNWEYFKGKADAYEYSYKTFKRILEWTASGSVAAPKEEGAKVFKCKACNYSGPFPDCVKVYCEKYDDTENTALREALKDLLPIAERKFNATSHREYIALKAIIERARKLISK